MLDVVESEIFNLFFLYIIENVNFKYFFLIVYICKFYFEKIFCFLVYVKKYFFNFLEI